VEEFKSRYGCDPDFITRAPGRVNLIGEHIDYEGYGVLPFAIEKDCVIVVGLADTKTIEIKHMLSNKYPDHTISSDVK
jgi:galactokinase